MDAKMENYKIDQQKSFIRDSSSVWLRLLFVCWVYTWLLIHAWIGFWHEFKSRIWTIQNQIKKEDCQV